MVKILTKFLALIIFVALFVIFSTDLSIAATNVSSCGYLNSGNTTYTLNQSIEETGTDCIIINATNITLDCQGYNISFGGLDISDERGIDNQNGFSNTTIKNCVLLKDSDDDEGYGIYFEGAIDSVIYNNTIETSGTYSYGIYIKNSTNSNITSNTIETLGEYSDGIYSLRSNFSIITRNNITLIGDLGYGANIRVSLYNNITSNTVSIYGSTARGIESYNMGSGLIYNNNITVHNASSIGIGVETGSINNNITLNTITTSGSGGYGIYMSHSDKNLIFINTITTSGTNGYGILTYISNSSEIFNNTITTNGSGGDGILMDHSSFNNLTNNVMNTTNGYGLWISGTVSRDYNHTLVNNTEQGYAIEFFFGNNSLKIENKTIGQLIVVGSNNLTFTNLTLTTDNILFIRTENSTIKNCSIRLSGTSRGGGIEFGYSSFNKLINTSIITSGAQVHGIYLTSSNHSTFIGNEIRTGQSNSYVIYSDASKNNTFYNNVFNTSTNDSGFHYLNDVTTNSWNATKSSGANILGNNIIGGNFWTNNASSGWSDTCNDFDGDYICDNYYNFASDNTDYLPLVKHTNAIFNCVNLTVAKTYRFNQSLTFTGTCIRVKADDVTLDFNGFNITGNSGYGINITHYNNTVIKNGFIYNFSRGIYLAFNQNITIINMTSNNNNGSGIYLYSSSGNNITKVTANNNVVDGIKMEFTSRSESNVITHITANNNAGSGIYPSNFSQLQHITVNNNTYGISVGMSGVYIFNVTADNNTYYGLWIGGTSENNTFFKLNISNSRRDAIFLTGTTSSNKLINVTVSNTDNAYYDIKFSTASINNTRIIDTDLANYTFTEVGGSVNFRKSSFGEIKFIEPINGSGINLSKDILIRSNLISVNSSNNLGLNKSANITIYGVSYTDPDPQYSNDGLSFTNCLTDTTPACSEIGSSGNNYTFNTTHFTYFRVAEGYAASSTTANDTGGGGGGGAPSYWQMTFATTEEQFTKGQTKNISQKQRFRIVINGKNHYVGVIRIKPTTVTINVSSSPQQETLSIGDEKKFEVTGDEYYDIYVKLNSIDATTNKASLTVKSIYEMMPEEERPISEKITEEAKSLFQNIWFWIILIIVIVVVVAVIIKRRK